MVSPDAHELAAARDGHPEAQNALIARALPSVLAWCARLGGPRVDPEDAAQDVMIVVLARLHTVAHPDRFPAWVFGITRRVLAQHRRRVWLRRWLPEPAEESADWTHHPGARAELSEMGRRVQAALAELPQAQREVLILCDLEDRSDSEAADLLRIPLGTVRSRLRLARTRFLTVAAEHGLSGAELVERPGGS